MIKGRGIGQVAPWALEHLDPSKRISQRPMPDHLNLRPFRGPPPKDGKEVEVVIKTLNLIPS